jgi:hypothetical protein
MWVRAIKPLHNYGNEDILQRIFVSGFQGRNLINDYYNSLLSFNRIYCLSHYPESTEEQEMGRGNSVYHHSHAFSFEALSAEIEEKQCLRT